MSRMHELLAAETARTKQADLLLAETTAKFAKVGSYFQGMYKTLNMLEESPDRQAVEEAGAERVEMPTTVYETLEYFFPIWAAAEDAKFQKSLTNQVAKADIVLRGEVFAKDVPVDELLGLETRLTKLRNLLQAAPTLPATVPVTPLTDRNGGWVGNPEVTTKTQKVMVPVILAEATQHHPAQVRESSTDKVIGKFTTTKIYGQLSAKQKAGMLSIMDELIVEVMTARKRANMQEVVPGSIGSKITELLMGQLEG